MNSIITPKAAAVRVLTLCGPMLICGLVGNAQARSDRITFAADGKRVFESIVTLTAQQRVPVGIVIKDAKPLCEKATITLSDATVKEIVDVLLIRSPYSAKMVGSVLEIIPDQQPDEATLFASGFISAARSFAMLLISFTGTGSVSGKRIVPFRSSYPLSSFSSVAKKVPDAAKSE